LFQSPIPPLGGKKKKIEKIGAPGGDRGGPAPLGVFSGKKFFFLGAPPGWGGGKFSPLIGVGGPQSPFIKIPLLLGIPFRGLLQALIPAPPPRIFGGAPPPLAVPPKRAKKVCPGRNTPGVDILLTSSPPKISPP